MAIVRRRECTSCESFKFPHSRALSSAYSVRAVTNKFATLYEPDTPHWSSIEELNDALNGTELISQTGAKYFQDHGISQKFTYELVEAATRVSYAQVRQTASLLWSLNSIISATQDVDSIHGLVTVTSLVVEDVGSVKGGNWQIFEQFVERSGAQVFLKTEVDRLLCLSLANP